MRIETDKLAKAIRLSQRVTSGQLKSEIPELQMLSLVIRDHSVYVLAQGDSGESNVRLLATVGREEDIEFGNYIISGDRLLRVLNESGDDEVEVTFGDHSVEVVTSLGLTRYESVADNLQTELNIGTNYEHVFEDIQEQIAYTKDEGDEIANSTWASGLSVLRASTSDTDSVSLIFQRDHVSLSAPYAEIRYRTDFPFVLPMPIAVAKVMEDVVKYDVSDTHAYVSGDAFAYVSEEVYVGVYGLGGRVVLGRSNYDWDITGDDGFAVLTEELRRVIRVSDIFLTSSGEDILFEVKYQDGKLRVFNKGEDGYGADLTLDIQTGSEKADDDLQVLGEYLQKILVLTEDDEVELELLGAEGIHIVFSEGDARLTYIG